MFLLLTATFHCSITGSTSYGCCHMLLAISRSRELDADVGILVVFLRLSLPPSDFLSRTFLKLSPTAQNCHGPDKQNHCASYWAGHSILLSHYDLMWLMAETMFCIFITSHVVPYT